MTWLSDANAGWNGHRVLVFASLGSVHVAFSDRMLPTQRRATMCETIRKSGLGAASACIIGIATEY